MLHYYFFIQRERQSGETQQKQRALRSVLLMHSLTSPDSRPKVLGAVRSSRWRSALETPSELAESKHVMLCSLMCINELMQQQGRPFPCVLSFLQTTHTHKHPPFHLWPFNSHFCSPCVSPASFWTSSSELIGQKCCWLHPTYPKP